MKINIDIIACIKKYIIEHFPNKYNFSNKHQKYELYTIIYELFYMLKTGISYNDYRGPVNSKSLYYHFKFFKNNNIFLNVYKQLLDKYYSTNKQSKLKYQMTDTSFIQNNNGINKIGRNKFYKNKRGTKISSIIDSNGMHISVLLKSGNKNDSKFIEHHMKNMYIVTNANEYKKYNRYKQYMLADKGYDSTENRKILLANGYIPIIDYNRRNTKNPKKLKYFTQKEQDIYKKRIKIEICFCYMKKNKRLNIREDKHHLSYLSYLHMALIKTLFNKLTV